jgi:hypothetical protein
MYLIETPPDYLNDKYAELASDTLLEYAGQDLRGGVRTQRMPQEN